MNRFFFVLIVLITFYSCEKSNKSIKNSNSTEINKINIDSLNIPEKQKALKTYFDSLCQFQGFNGNVLIAQEGIIVYVDSFGMGNFKRKDTLTLNHSFQLASLSKQFTAVAVLQLVEQGKLSLDDSVQMIFPEFPYHGITIHMLLCHRSGLPNYTYFMDSIFEDKKTAVYNNIVLDSLIQIHPQWYYPPDITFEYSNTGYMLLASIVEKVSGQMFYNYVKKNIFDRIGMKRSFFNIYTLDTIDIATGYLYGKMQAVNNLIDGVVGDKGLYSSVYDMFKWDQALSTEKLLKMENIKKAFSPQGKDNSQDENYGYGWRLHTSDYGDRVVYHGGWWRGFQNVYIHVPEKKWCIIVLSNRKTKNYIRHSEIFDILLMHNENK